MISVIVFILILAVLIIIHELGHFIAAKWNGVKVEEFGFGFPPRIVGVKRGETLYSLNALPIGGFVKVYGEEYRELDTKKNRRLLNRAFVYKKPGKKAVIVVAGVIMNFLLAVGIYYVLLAGNHFQSDPLLLLNKYRFRFGRTEERIVFGSVLPDTPAYKAGLAQGDTITAIRMIPATNLGETGALSSPEGLISFINAARNTPLEIKTENIRNGTKKTVVVQPYYRAELKRFVIGVSLGQTVVLHYDSSVEKALAGFLHSYNVSVYNLSLISQLISSSFKEKSFGPVSQAVSGPIGIFGEIDDIMKNSGGKTLINLLNVVALLSLSLGTINILPFPALDGGRLVFIAYEWITKKRAGQRLEQYVNLAGIIFLLTIAGLVSLNDILRLLHK